MKAYPIKLAEPKLPSEPATSVKVKVKANLQRDCPYSRTVHACTGFYAPLASRGSRAASLWSGHRALRATTARAKQLRLSRPRRFRLRFLPNSRLSPWTATRFVRRMASRLRRRFRAKEGEGYVLHTDVEEVALNCTVLEGNRLVSELKKENFKVFEDGRAAEAHQLSALRPACLHCAGGG